jgi:FtsZ-binding cell division protein ZapB
MAAGWLRTKALQKLLLEIPSIFPLFRLFDDDDEEDEDDDSKDDESEDGEEQVNGNGSSGALVTNPVPIAARQGVSHREEGDRKDVVDNYKGLVSKLKSENMYLLTERQAIKRERGALRRDKGLLLGQVDELKKDIEKMKKEQDKIKKENEKVKRQNTKLTDQIDASTKARLAKCAEAAELQTRLDKLKGTLAKLVQSA